MSLCSRLAGAVELGRTDGLPQALVGVTVVGVGTAMPKLVTGLLAALTDAPAIAVGSVLGSNFANILLILGLAVCLARALRQEGGQPRDNGDTMATR